MRQQCGKMVTANTDLNIEYAILVSTAAPVLNHYEWWMAEPGTS
jgi:hypothetical protein